MSEENLIEIRGITKTYPSKRGDVDALGRIDLSVAKGEFMSTRTMTVFAPTSKSSIVR